MKVVHVLNTGGYSGAENVVITIINHLKKENFDCVYLSPYGDISQRLDHEGIKYYAVDHLSLKSLKKAFNELQPNIIHAHDFNASVLSALCFPKAKVISHIHNNTPWMKNVNLKSIAFLLASLRNSQILTVSDSVEEEFVFKNFIHKKIKCISNPIDLSVIRKKADLWTFDEYYDILFMGRLTEQKNPHMIVSVFKELSNRHPRIKIAIIGDGESNIYFHNELDKYKNIRFFGFLDNPYPIVKNCKCLFMPSKWEGFGLVAAEALALGLPVVASNVGGLPDIITDQCGLLSQNEQDYIDELEKLVFNNNYYLIKHNNALKRIEDIENIDEYMRTIIQIYQQLA